jgi:hypothetical protein
MGLDVLVHVRDDMPRLTSLEFAGKPHVTAAEELPDAVSHCSFGNCPLAVALNMTL